jgi:branched-chain amino acid aminotransferase
MIKESKKIWMDGKFVDWADANIHILTHTLHYGLGVFEGIRCYKTPKGPAIFRLKEHVERLFNSCHILQIKIPYTPAQISKAIIDSVKVNRLKECYIRPIVYIGYGVMGIDPRDNPIRLAIAVWPWGAYLYVNSLLAKREAALCGYDEAILLDTQGFVAEGSGQNIFIVRKGALKTMPIASVLEGITRNSVLEMAEDSKIKVIESNITRDELYIADEAFFTGTAAEITPIREVDKRIIGKGKPGPITKKLQNLFFKIVKGNTRQYKSCQHFLSLPAFVEASFVCAAMPILYARSFLVSRFYVKIKNILSTA